MTSTRRLLAAAIGAAAIAAGAVAPAGAQTPTSSPASLADRFGTTVPDGVPTTGPAAGTASPNGDQLAGRYRTLTATMMERWAQRSGAAVEDLAGPNPELLAGILGRSSTEELRNLGVAGVLGSLDETISKVTLGVAGTGTSFERLATALPSILATPDGATIAAGVYRAHQLARLEVPQLQSPGLLQNAAPLSSIGPDSLAFGLFLNQSLTSLAQRSPDVFSAVLRPGGVADPTAVTAWSEARTQAAQRLNSGFSGDLMNPCLAVLVASLASGDRAGNPALSGTPDGCRPCAVAGAYMGSQMSRVLDGTTPQRLIIPDDGVITPYEWWQAGDGARDLYYRAYPGLRDLVESQQHTASEDARRKDACAVSQAGVANFLADHSRTILSRLGG